jgi:hypothetical protein
VGSPNPASLDDEEPSFFVNDPYHAASLDDNEDEDDEPVLSHVHLMCKCSRSTNLLISLIPSSSLDTWTLWRQQVHAGQPWLHSLLETYPQHLGLKITGQ